MSVYADLKVAGSRAGGSHLTREARQLTVNRFSDYLKNKNIQIKGVEHVREKHIIGYLAQRNVSERVKQNELSHLRVSLTHAGREDFVSRLGTQRMGVEKASRSGTHRAIQNEEYKVVREVAQGKDAGVAAAIQLCRELGLRSMEAAILRQDTLRSFERSLIEDGRVFVHEGTKGGRDRWSQAINKERALDAVREAIKVAESNRKGYLVVGRNCDLKSAINKFHRISAECGLKGKVSPHSLRYAYACDRVEQMMGSGYSKRESFVIASHDLGHGDSRGAFVERVYYKR